MKKKILSLLVAGVVALGTAMPASATSTQVIQGNQGASEATAPVRVTGAVMDNQNTDQSGRIHVEMPTAMAFTVYSDGSFHAGSFAIENKGKDEVNVSVASFQETKPNEGITVVGSEAELNSQDRSHVYLKLSGNTGNEIELGKSTLSTDTVATIAPSGTATIQLDGKVGTEAGNVDTNGANEDFNLVFKITK